MNRLLQKFHEGLSKVVQVFSIQSLTWNKIAAGALIAFSCTSKILKYEKEDQLKNLSEFDQVVKIDNIPESADLIKKPVDSANSTVLSANSTKNSNSNENSNTSSNSKANSDSNTNSNINSTVKTKNSEKGVSDSIQSKNMKPDKAGGDVSAVIKAQDEGSKKSQRQNEKKNKIKKPKLEASSVSPVVDLAVSQQKAKVISHLPDIENGVGFDGRRPIVDPFRVGETIVHDVHYFKVSAGELEMKVNPPKFVNGRKSYSFGMGLKSGRVFSSFYKVDDLVETLVDWETFVPSVFSLHVKESGQLREARNFFDFSANKASYWEKKYTETHGDEEKKQQWNILPFSQNVFSAIFYMRLFKWEVGQEYVFRIADDEENILFKGKAIRNEKLSTKAGDFDTVVIRPEVMVKGLFKPIGDVYFWLSNDDRKYILRMELKIKIGTLISEVVKIEPGVEGPSS